MLVWVFVCAVISEKKKDLLAMACGFCRLPTNVFYFLCLSRGRKV